ncbi:MAG: hypothetical protein KME20_01365 [Kaiparowitsia implicata GSE-PSE-MK54-09C]|jgi:hypothetical protein|nr:hypothetical protein [Kaiparowitsia implicata GSE-PSE-MK54-09C]
MSSEESLEFDVSSPDVQVAISHWRQFRPTMTAELEAKGELEQVAIAAVTSAFELERTLHMDLSRRGYDSPTAFVLAQRIAQERFVLLPSEEDVPDLFAYQQAVMEHEPNANELPDSTR